MECQSGCPLKYVNLACFPGASLYSACPAFGSASIWAQARRTKIANIVALQGHTVRSRLADGMQTVKSYVRTQSPSVKRGARHLIPALPKQLRIKSPAPHPTDLGTARAAFNSACH